MTREEDMNPQIKNFFEEIVKRIEHLERDLRDLESRLVLLEKEVEAVTNSSMFSNIPSQT